MEQESVMSRGFSRVVLVGNLGGDPEMRYSQNGTPITNFSIAVNRRRRGQDGQYQDETSWFRVTLFRQQAEFAAEWLHKGNKVLVEGELQIRNFTGRDGVERTSVDVLADNFMNLTSREESMEGGGYGGGYQQNRPAGGQGQGQGQMSQQPARQAPAGERPQQPKQNDAFDDDYDLDDVPF
jgi:single-strand DNA-binding protein